MAIAPTQALLISHDQSILDLIRLALEGRYGIKVSTAASFQDVQKELAPSPDPRYRVVISDFALAGRQLASCRPTLARDIAYSFLAEEPPLHEELPDGTSLFEFIKLPFDSNALFTHFESRGIFAPLPTAESDQTFCRIRTTFLLSVVPLCGDIYIRLSDTKYVKLFNEGTVFDEADAKKWGEMKKQEYLYLRRYHAERYADRLAGNFRDILLAERPGSPPCTDGLAAQIAENPAVAFEAISEVSEAMGFSPRVLKLARAGVEVALVAVQKSHNLKRIMNSMARETGRYLSYHSFLAGHLACLIAAQLEWNNEATFEKLMFAALVHDFTLRGTRLADVRELKDLDNLNPKPSKVERQEFFDHSLRAAELCLRFKEIPPDVDYIVASHHEKPDGSGFPRGISGSRIALLSSVFIVAHDLSEFILDLKSAEAINKENLVSFFEKRNYLYTKDSFRKILKIVPKLKLD